jgi:hypothetical protein
MKPAYKVHHPMPLTFARSQALKIDASDKVDTPTGDLSLPYMEITNWQDAISSAVKMRSLSDLSRNCRNFKLFLQGLPDDIQFPPSVFNPHSFTDLLLEPLFEANQIDVIISIIELYDRIFEKCHILHPWQFLRPALCQRFQTLLHIGHDSLTASLVRFLARMPDGTPESAERAIAACPFELVRSISDRGNGYLVSEAIACYVRALSETGLPDDQTVDAVTFFVDRLANARFHAVSELVWAIRAVVKRPSVCQAVVDGVPALPIVLAQRVRSADEYVRRGIAVILGSLAAAGCRMPGYDRKILVDAMWNDNCAVVRCLAVSAITFMILNSRNQEQEDRFSNQEVSEIVRKMIRKCHEESFIVCQEMVNALPRIVKSAVPVHAYRAIVSDGLFEGLGRLVVNLGLREAERGRAVFGLITDMFRVSLIDGWARECVEAFENEGGWAILDALMDVQDEKLITGIDELSRRINEWQSQEDSFHE